MGLFCMVVGGGRFVLGRHGWSWVYFSWSWVEVDLFWMEVDGVGFILRGGGWLWMVLSLYRVVVGRGGFIWMVQRLTGRLETSLLFYRFQNLLMDFIIEKMNQTRDRGKIFW